MLKLDELIDNWVNDTDIDPLQAHNHILEIPKLHGKYLSNLSQAKLSAKKIKNQYLKLRQIKISYYTGEFDQEDYKLYGYPLFNKKVLKDKVEPYLDADDDLIKLLDKQVYYQEVASFCESCLKDLNSRSYSIGNYLKHVQFLAGK